MVDPRSRTLEERVAKIEAGFAQLEGETAKRIELLEALVDACDEVTAADDAYYAVEWTTDDEEAAARDRIDASQRGYDQARAAIYWKPRP